MGRDCYNYSLNLSTRLQGMPFQTLVTSEALAAHLGDPGWVVLDCRFDLADPDMGRALYMAGHIPGAHYAHLDRDLARKPAGGEGRHPLPSAAAFAERVAQWGVTPDSQVVVYDDSGGGFASRAWWMVRWIGHPNVALLDGGYALWLAQGRDVSTVVPPTVNDGVAPGAAAGRDWVTTTATLLEGLAPGEQLLDARAAERFAGEVEPIDPVAGHVPGAVNYPFTDSLAADGRFKSPAAIRAQLERVLDGAKGHQVIAMCGSGVTACHLLLSMEIAGLTGGRLYAGSWSEWVADESRPVAIGPADPGPGS